MVIAGAAGAHLGGYTEARRVGSSHVNAPRIQPRSEPECGAGAEDRSDQDRRATFPRAGRAVPQSGGARNSVPFEARVPGRIPPTTAVADLPRGASNPPRALVTAGKHQLAASWGMACLVKYCQRTAKRTDDRVRLRRVMGG